MSNRTLEHLTEIVGKPNVLYSQKETLTFEDIIPSESIDNISTFPTRKRGDVTRTYASTNWSRYLGLWSNWKPVRRETTSDINTSDDRADGLVQLIQSWMDEGDTDEQQETLDYLIHALDEDRLSNRKLFPEEMKGKSW